jgi:hypothetical protein
MGGYRLESCPEIIGEIWYSGGEALDLDWDAEDIRRKCREGTERERQAYIRAGYQVDPDKQDPVAALLERPNKASIKEMAQAVAQRHRLTFDELLSRNKQEKFVNARREAYHICYTKLGASLPQLARVFGRDPKIIHQHLKQMHTEMRAKGHPGFLWVRG